MKTMEIHKDLSKVISVFFYVIVFYTNKKEFKNLMAVENLLVVKNAGLWAFESGSRLSGLEHYKTMSSLLDVQDGDWILLSALAQSKKTNTSLFLSTLGWVW